MNLFASLAFHKPNLRFMCIVMMPNYITISIPIYVSDAYDSKRGWDKNVVAELVYYGLTLINLFAICAFHKPNLRFMCIFIIPNNPP